MADKNIALDSAERISNRNEEYKRKFRQNFLFNLMNEGYFNTDERKQIFMAYLQVWANQFQRLMMIKTALCEDPVFSKIYKQHFFEEIGHDDLLKKDRKAGLVLKKDPILEALANWFPSKILSYSLEEQLVMVHLVLEGGANIFYEIARVAIDPENKFNYFEAHKEVDCEHEKMGLDLLTDLPERQVTRLLDILDDSWGVTEALMQRIGELVIQNQQNK